MIFLSLLSPAPRVYPEPDLACVIDAEIASSWLALADGDCADPHTVDGDFSVDLGKRSVASLQILADGVALDGAEPCVTWDELQRIAQKGGAWQLFRGYEPKRIEGHSELTQRTASLYPTPGGAPPTVVLGGFNMHRIKGEMNPAVDTRAKLDAIGRSCRGRVLDVCTGLGYTAIAAAERAAVTSVDTIELDPLMAEIQRKNPWSAALFDDPKITRHLADAVELLPAFDAGSFDVVVHDPPAQAMAGELYSASFYAELRRVLRPNGILYHYIGDPSSKASGKLFRGVGQRLRDAGFGTTQTVARAYGELAWPKR